MANTDMFVINYDPIERTVNFAIHKSSGVVVNIDDGEPLKYYENNDGLFSIEGQYNMVFDYIKENFNGKSEVLLLVNVFHYGFNKREIEFERFGKNIEKFNKDSDIRINLKINVKGLETNQKNPSMSPEPKVGEAEKQNCAQEDDIPTEVKPKVKVAVVGKISSGKTMLIAGLTEHNKSSCEIALSPPGTTQYYDTKNNVIWYEIDGIEIGKENVDKARKTLDKLIEANGVTIVLYCLSSKAGKIEDIERNFIVDIKQKYPNVTVYAVITASFEEKSSHYFAECISNLTKQTKVFIVLAKEMPTNVGFLPPFGLDEISKYIYEG